MSFDQSAAYRETLLKLKKKGGTQYYANSDGSRKIDYSDGSKLWSDGRGLVILMNAVGSGYSNREFAATPNNTIKDAQAINRSLSTLGKIMHALTCAATQGTDQTIHKPASVPASIADDLVSANAPSELDKEDFEMVSYEEANPSSSVSASTTEIEDTVVVTERKKEGWSFWLG